MSCLTQALKHNRAGVEKLERLELWSVLATALGGTSDVDCSMGCLITDCEKFSGRSRTQSKKVDRLAFLRSSIRRRIRRHITQNDDRSRMCWYGLGGVSSSHSCGVEAGGYRGRIQGGGSSRLTGVLEGWWCSIEGGFAGAGNDRQQSQRTQGVANDDGGMGSAAPTMLVARDCISIATCKTPLYR